MLNVIEIKVLKEHYFCDIVNKEDYYEVIKMNFQDVALINEIDVKNANFYYENFQLKSFEKYFGYAELIKIKKNETFFPNKNYFGVINSGRFQRTLINYSGLEKVIRILGAGNLIGEIVYFLNKTPEDSFIALTDGEIYVFKKEIVENILLDDKEIVREIIQWLCLHSAAMSVQLEESLDRDLHYKISKFLYNYINDFGYKNDDGTMEYKGRLSQKDIARYLGLNRVCVNRECNSLINEGKIERKNNYWKIIDIKYFENLTHHK